MREIKFRAWDKRNKIMCYDHTDDCDSWLNDSLSFLNACFIDENYEWLQFTGLYDKNGKKIYEGDYVIFTIDDDWYGYPSVEAIVEYCEPEYMFKGTPITNFPVNKDKLIYYSFSSGCPIINIQVIGNIYENPELLEQKS